LEPPDTFRIREANRSDLDILISFAFREAVDTEGSAPAPSAVEGGVRNALEGSAPATYWVAESTDGAVAGSISVVTEWSNFRGGYYWWIQSLFIVPEHRGSGLVDQMFDHVVEAARQAGALDLRLHVLRSNSRAIGAYERCSFEEAPYLVMIRRTTDR